MKDTRKKHIFKIRKVFYMVLVSYVLILLLPITAGVILSVRMDRMNEERVVEDVREQMSAGLNNFYVKLEQLDMLCVQIFNNVDLWQVRKLGIPKYGTRQIREVMNVADAVKSYGYSLSQFQDFSLILDNGQIYTASSTVFGLEHYYSGYMGYVTPDFDTWKYNSFSKKYVGREFYAYERRPLKGTGAPESIGLVYQYAPGINLVGGVRTEVIQCLFTRDQLSEYFSALLSIEGSQVHIYDREGNVLVELGEGENRFGSISMAKATGKAGISESLDYVVIRQSFDDGNYDVATSIPRDFIYQELRNIQMLIFVLIGLILAVEVILGIFFSWRYSWPIKNLIRNIDNMKGFFVIEQRDENHTREGEKEAVSEYQYLTNRVDQILKSQRTMKEDLDSHVKQNLEHFYEDLFRNHYLDEEEIEVAATHIGLTLAPSRYCVVAFSGLTRSNWEEVQKERSHIAVVSSMNAQFLMVLYEFDFEATDEEIFGWLKEQLEAINEVLQRYGERSCNIGVGKIYDKEKQIHFSYIQAQYATMKLSPLRENGLLFYGSLSGMDTPFYPVRLAEKLVNAAQSGNEKLVEEIFGEIEEENIKQRALSKQMYEILFSNLCASLIDIYSDVVARDEVNQIVAQCQEQRADVKERLLYIKNCFQKVCKESREREPDVKGIFTDYITCGYMDPQMGISMAAEDFSLSESYFSRYFKDVMREGFSTCLEQVRMEKARELLYHTDLTIQEISGKVGYGNSNTFRRAFQRIYGISPSDWRKK